MRYAVLKLGSIQYKVSEGDLIKVAGTNDKPKFEVLFFSDKGKAVFDKDALKEVKVAISSEGTARGRKLRVGRFKAKSRYDKVRGYRDTFTNIRVDSILFGAEEKAEKPAKVEKKTVEKKIVVKKTGTKLAAPKKAVAKKVK